MFSIDWAKLCLTDDKWTEYDGLSLEWILGRSVSKKIWKVIKNTILNYKK